MDSSGSGGTCQICSVEGKYTHSVREHQVASQLVDPFLDFVKTDAFSNGDRRMSYAEAIARFNVDTSPRRMGRVLDAMSRILLSSGWPPVPVAGIAAYVVNASYGAPAPAADLDDIIEDDSIEIAAEAAATASSQTIQITKPATSKAHSSAELLEEITGIASDAPLCMTCGIKMRTAGSCYVCEGCGSTSGCS